MRIGSFGESINSGTIDDVVAEARQAEADGFASFWVPNIFGHDALTALAIVGRKVPRIELGTSVVPTYPRHPSAIAQQCLTVSAACEGRLTLGIGLSHKVVIESMLGMSYDKSVRHIRDYLSILGPLSRNEPVSYRGEDYSTNLATQRQGRAAVRHRRRRPRTADVEGDRRTRRRHADLVHGSEHAGDHIVPTITPPPSCGATGATRDRRTAGVRDQRHRRSQGAGPRRCSRSTVRCRAIERCSIAKASPDRRASP